MKWINLFLKVLLRLNVPLKFTNFRGDLLASKYFQWFETPCEMIWAKNKQ